jgi:hypothetical protein
VTWPAHCRNLMQFHKIISRDLTSFFTSKLGTFYIVKIKCRPLSSRRIFMILYTKVVCSGEKTQLYGILRVFINVSHEDVF